MKKRTGEPWMPADRYGRSLPKFAVNLIVRDISRAVAFYHEVMSARVLYADPDFAALQLMGHDMMLHADHTYDQHPWYPRLENGGARGLGAELRLFGVDPDALEERARRNGAVVVQQTTSKGHGWREVMVEDPDGYLWAVGVATARSQA